MNTVFQRIFALFLCLCMLPLLPAFPVQADEASTEPSENENLLISPPPQQQAEDITSAKLFSDLVNLPSVWTLVDGNIYYGYAGRDHASLTITYEAGIGSLYMIFMNAYGTYTMTNNDTGAVHACGENGFLHEFIDVEAIFGSAPTSVTLAFDNGPVTISEISVFTPGEVPPSVQKWSVPADGKTDLILFSTHGDDEQLFFAGLLPYYAKERGYQVQVVYLTDHRNTSKSRVHEMLNGLWAVGVDTYPIFGVYPDFRYNSLNSTYAAFSYLGYTKENMLGFVVEQIRRFDPLVVVGHDFAGEYGHGQHMVYADLLAQALEISNDPTAYPELAERYGVHEVSKAYFHLYGENQIRMDWDQPLDSFGGMTAFEVTQKLGFPCHISQQKNFGFWIKPYKTAAELPEHSPCLYGLYKTTVGPDVEKNDMFENILSYKEQADLEAARQRAEEEAERKAEAEKEAARQKAEEEARLKALEAAKQKAEEEAHLKAEEAARLLAEEQNALSRRRRGHILLVAAVSAIALLGSAAAISTAEKKEKNN